MAFVLVHDDVERRIRRGATTCIYGSSGRSRSRIPHPLSFSWWMDGWMDGIGGSNCSSVVIAVGR